LLTISQPRLASPLQSETVMGPQNTGTLLPPSDESFPSFPGFSFFASIIESHFRPDNHPFSCSVLPAVLSLLFSKKASEATSQTAQRRTQRTLRLRSLALGAPRDLVTDAPLFTLLLDHCFAPRNCKFKSLLCSFAFSPPEIYLSLLHPPLFDISFIFFGIRFEGGKRPFGHCFF